MSKFYTGRVVKDVKNGHAVCFNGFTFMKRGNMWWWHQNGCQWKQTESYEYWLEILEVQISISFKKVSSLRVEVSAS